MNFAFLFALLPCAAQEPATNTEFQDAYYMMPGQSQVQMQYFSGYTMLTIFGYHVKVIAEQRSTDNMAQVVILPQEEGINFQIQNVNFEVLPQGMDYGGPVAEVQGNIAFRIGENPTVQSLTVPVQISDVEDFSINYDEAITQGNVVYRKQLPNMLSSQ